MHSLKFITIIGAALALAAPAHAAPLDDAAILSIFDQANTADITTARLGVKRAQSSEVKALAAMVLTDHEAVQQMGRTLGKNLGIIAVPPDNDTALADQAKAYAALQAVPPADFDQAYLLHEIAFHQAVIDAVKGTLLPSITHPDLKALVTKVLPGFEHHLAATRQVAARLAAQ
jgi:putative membrane protein